MNNISDSLVTWQNSDATIETTCPLCGKQGNKQHLLDMLSPFPDADPLQLVICDGCESGFVHDYPDADYSTYRITDEHIRFYVEQGAGIDILARPGYLAGKLGFKNYLEIGCGYGFGVDFAKQAMGLNARGIDPAFQATMGSKELGIEIMSEYLSASSAETLGKQDMIVAMEVIEHIADTQPFLNIIRANLSDSGVVVMSTPNVKALEDRHSSMLLPVLSPGYHAILFSRQALEEEFRKAGFRQVHIDESPHSLFVIASPSEKPVGEVDMVDGDIFADYTWKRAGELQHNDRLWTGFVFRHLKSVINHGDYDRAHTQLEKVIPDYMKRFDLALDRPFSVAARYLEECDNANNYQNRSDWVRQLPFHLCNLYYYVGVLMLNTRGAKSAVDYFIAGVKIADAQLEQYELGGFGDGETEVLRGLSLELQAKCAEMMK